MANYDKEAFVSYYQIRITNPLGNIVKILDEFVSVDYARKINDIGELSLTVFDNGERDIFIPENRIEVWRKKGDDLKLDCGAVWFIYSVIHTFSKGGLVFEVKAADQICLLDRRIIPYNEGNPTTEKQDTGDNVMKAIMRENFGTLATDTDRDLSDYLTIQEDTSDAPQVTVFCAKDKVLDTLQEISNICYENGTFVAFDIIYNPITQTFEFATFIGQRGVDRSYSLGDSYLLVGIEYGSIESMSFIQDREKERNYIYAGAKDLVGIIPPQTAVDTVGIGISPFNRKELFLNASSSDDEDELQTEADAALEDNRYKPSFEAQLSQEFALSSYGELFNYGDKISVSFDGQIYAAFINTISVQVDPSGEKIDVKLVNSND